MARRRAAVGPSLPIILLALVTAPTLAYTMAVLDLPGAVAASQEAVRVKGVGVEARLARLDELCQEGLGGPLAKLSSARGFSSSIRRLVQAEKNAALDAHLAHEQSPRRPITEARDRIVRFAAPSRRDETRSIAGVRRTIENVKAFANARTLMPRDVADRTSVHTAQLNDALTALAGVEASIIILIEASRARSDS